jgi:hypothetical protein
MTWLRYLESAFGLDRRGQRRPRRTQDRVTRKSRRLLHLEALENRIAPATVSWINAGGGDWDTASNWRDDQGINRLPGPNDDAVINVAGNVTITHSQGVTDTIKSLTASDPVILSGGTLRVASSLSDTSAMTLSGGTLAGASVASGTVLNVNSNSTLDGVTLSGDMEVYGYSTTVTAVNGLTLQNVTVGLNSPQYNSPVTLALSGSAPETLAGTGRVVFNNGVQGIPPALWRLASR